MSSEQQNRPNRDVQPTPEEKEQTADVRDLVIKPGYATDSENAENVIDNPAITPQMLDEHRGEREDLKRD